MQGDLNKKHAKSSFIQLYRFTVFGCMPYTRIRIVYEYRYNEYTIL